MPSALKEQAVKGVTWSLIERFGIQSITLALGVILARLLTPEDFGLMGMVTVFFTVANVFVKSGFGAAYVQKKKVTEADANTVFYTNLAISLIVYAVLWVSAPLIADFYEQSQVVELTRVMGVMVVINAFQIVQIAQLKRDMNFQRQTKIKLISILMAGGGGVTAACYGLGVWSLVIQQLTNRFFMTSGFWLTAKWKPSFQFSKASFQTLFSFGGWQLLSGIVKTIFNNIYVLTIGKFFPAAEVGFYTKSKQFQRMASQQISQAVGSVAFPALSKLQDDQPRLQNAMRKFLMHTMIFMVPLLVTLMVLAEPFVILLLKQKWAPMIPYLQLLCIVGILNPIQAINVQVLKAQGKSNLNFRINLIKNTLRIINLFVMFRFGVIFIILGEVALSFLALIINTYYTHRLIDYGLLKQVNDVKHILLGGVAAGLIGYGATFQLTNLWLMFATGIISVLGGFTLIQFTFNRHFFWEVISLKDNFKQ